MEKLLCAFMVAASTTAAEPRTDEAVEFTMETAMYRLDQIAESLESFQVLTGFIMEETGALYPSMVPDSVTVISMDPARVLGAGNMEWDIQHIGFPNFVRYVRATLEAQRLRIMELELRVAELEGGEAALLDSMRHAVIGQAAVVEEYSTTGWCD